MHSIERYGIVALLFLVVTIVAVLLWDGKDEGEKPSLTPPVAALETAGKAGGRPAHRAAPTIEPAPSMGSELGDRSVLTAAARPGPLTRGLEKQRREPDPVVEQPLRLSGATPGSPGEALSKPVPEEAAFLSDSMPPAATRTDPVPTGGAAAATYTVRAGDTLSQIAQKQLGSVRRLQEIVAANPGLDPNKVRPGQTLRLPGGAAGPVTRAEPAAETPAVAGKASAKGSTYKVSAGDSLWRIAQKTLGDGNRWREIAALNPKIDPDRLPAGSVLVLPGGAKPTAPARTEPSRPERPPVVASRSSEAAAPQRRRGGKVQ